MKLSVYAYTTASGIHTFAHTAYCLCVERMKVASRPVNMIVSYNNMRKKKHFHSQVLLTSSLL